MIRKLNAVLRCRRGAPSGDAGMSLIELTVAMFVASILFAGVTTVFIGVLRASKTVNTKTATGADVRLATEAMSRTLRVATAPRGESAAFLSASATGMSFYALLNRSGATSTTEPIATLVTYSYSSNCLYESQITGVLISSPAAAGPFFSWPAAAAKTKCLMQTTTAPSFAYYSDYTSPTSNTSTATLKQIRNVMIKLTASDPNNPTVTGVPTETLISLENLINADGT